MASERMQYLADLVRSDDQWIEITIEDPRKPKWLIADSTHGWIDYKIEGGKHFAKITAEGRARLSRYADKSLLMTLNEYQDEVVQNDYRPRQRGLSVLSFGLKNAVANMTMRLGQVGTSATPETKPSFDDIRDTLIDELSESIWSITLMAHELDATLEDIARRNLEKMWDE
jgi:hypothetical protein